jgi:luciferase family oxidoreductase group 1
MSPMAACYPGGMAPPFSILDLAVVERGSSVRDALDACVATARRAEQLGYRRVWYAEHHNMKSIASSATSVVIAHVAAHTTTIRLGSGGIMLPNHSPLTIAEQFGTLATLHPGRIDLGLGRAPGTDQPTMRALRRDPHAADTFPRDVLELRAFLGEASRIPGVQAIPGRDTFVPLYILGSSLFGAQLAAALGLPYAFASHFAPTDLEDAVALYRREFRPSQQCEEPYVMAAVNVVVGPDAADAERQHTIVTRSRVARFLRAERELADDEIDAILESREGRQIASKMHYTAVGDPERVHGYLERFADHVDADELVLVFAAPTQSERLAALELVATTFTAAPAG